jgi:CBS domain containing-hemolysin-like protein
MPVTIAFYISAMCLVTEMFFAASEISIISCDRIGLRKLATEGHGSARILESFLSNKQRLLATTLVGSQLSVVVSTVVMTYALHHLFPNRAELYLLLVLTPTTVVLGEIVPKTIGQQSADRIARLCAYPLWLCSKLFAPTVWLLTKFTTWVLRLLGVPERKLVTREELELMLKGPAGPQKSEITEGERKMISKIFEFTDTTVYDVMVPLSDVVALREEATVEEAAREIEEKQYTRYPVYKERVDRIVGTVHAFDVLKAGRSPTHLGMIARAPIFVPTSQPAVDLLVELQRSRQGMAIVVDEYGGAVGIATIEDILEEIVGEIEDEHDVKPPAIRKEADGVWRIAARVAVAEVNRELRLELPEGEDYESVAGLILDRLKHIPREGESVRFNNVLIKVTRASERAVEEVQLRLGKRRSPVRGPGTIPG